jgi:hypothetical protein
MIALAGKIPDLAGFSWQTAENALWRFGLIRI